MAQLNPLAITGGRQIWPGPAGLQWFLHLARWHAPWSLMIGDCPTGVDRFFLLHARHNHWPYKKYDADWAQHGRAAGPIRNGVMLADQPVALCVFSGGDGTHDCLMQALLADRAVYLYPGHGQCCRDYLARTPRYQHGHEHLERLLA